MFEHQDVADHQLRAGYARDLVVRKIPWLDTEKHADWLDVHGCARRFREWTGLQIGARMLCVVVENVCRRFHFLARFAAALAHFQRQIARVFVGLPAQQRRRARHDARPIADGTMAPVSFESALRGSELRFEQLVGYVVVGGKQFAGCWIGSRVWHEVLREKLASSQCVGTC
ncbi:hypothetical protein QF002_008603 [Paraburkholderia youngii]